MPIETVSGVHIHIVTISINHRFMPPVKLIFNSHIRELHFKIFTYFIICANLLLLTLFFCVLNQFTSLFFFCVHKLAWQMM